MLKKKNLVEASDSKLCMDASFDQNRQLTLKIKNKINMEAKTSDKAIIAAMGQKEIKSTLKRKKKQVSLLETTVGLSMKLLLLGSGQVLDTTFY